MAEFMDNVHSDILLNILSRVPTESVLDCKLVCKKWGNLLRKKYFMNMHVRRLINQLYGGDDVGKVDTGFICTGKVNELNRYELLYHGGLLHHDKTNTDEDYPCKTITLQEIMKRPSMPSDMRGEYLVGSCNGLICLGRYHHGLIDPIYIFNPITGDYTHLPKFIVPKNSHPRNNCTARGFGYVPSTNEYKVVRIYYGYIEGVGKVARVQVYTLGSGCGWRTKQGPFPRVNHLIPGTFANGAIYWALGSKIHAFDLANEEFRRLSSPLGDTINYQKGNFGFVVLGRNLCFFNQVKNKIAPYVEIWTFKKTDAIETWSKDFNMVYGVNEMCPSHADTLQPISLTKNNELIYTCNRETLCCYNIDAETWRVILEEDEYPSQPFDIVSVIPHVNTFVSFETLGEKTRKTVDASLPKW